MQKVLIQDVYSKANINPANVAYVEAHGTGTPVGDPEETNNIADFFCKDRSMPLLIGSIKSNIGHSEPASGMSALVKVLVAMETGVIAPNLHFKEPNPHIPALFDGRLKVVDMPTKWSGGLVGLNSFGFGGANAHVLLNWNCKTKLQVVQDKLPRIVVFSGRTEAVSKTFEKIEKMAIDDEFISLLHSVHRKNIPGHNYRGYTILGGSKTLREIKQYNNEKRPVWFVFSGIGSHWLGMAKELMQVEVFQNSIQVCAMALKQEGINLYDVLIDATEQASSKTINAFVGIVAVQIALVDVLRALSINPDGVVGHSIGELVCAYADGCLTAEQTILTAFFLGKGLLEAKLPPGSMFDAEISSEQIQPKLPSEIDVACIGGNENLTLSGPREEMKRLKNVLENDGIFTTEISSTGIAFNSRYVKAATHTLTTYVEKIIPYPKKRSSRWISTIVPESNWDTSRAQFSSAAYFVNSLLSPVLFQEALDHIPHNAIVVDVTMKCFLKTMLSRLIPITCTTIELMSSTPENSIESLFSSFGKMYNAGLQPDLAKFHPIVSYPVSRGTPMIAPLVDWDHSEEWTIASFDKGASRTGEHVFEVDLRNEEDEFLVGHTIDGRTLFPATGYLELVWRTFASMYGGENYEKLPVVFENVHFRRATIMSKDSAVKFLVNIFDGSGEFEVCTAGSLAVSGRIYTPDDVDKVMLDASFPWEESTSTQYLPLTSSDVYKDLRLRGYDYGGLFKGILSADNQCLSGELSWRKNWVTFMDTMLQFSILQKNTKELYLPTMIGQVIIDPRKQITLDDGVTVPVRFYRNINILKAGGVEIQGLKASLAPKRHQVHAQPILEKYCFLSYINQEPQVNDDALCVSIKIFLENQHDVLKVNVLELVSDAPPGNVLAPKILNILESEPMIQVSYTVASPFPEEYSKEYSNEDLDLKFINSDYIQTSLDDKRVHLIIARNKLRCVNDIEEKLSHVIEGGAFIILEEEATSHGSEAKTEGLQLVSFQRGNDQKYFLLRKALQLRRPVVVHMSENNFKWIDRLKNGLKQAETENCRVILVCQRERLNGIVGLVNCIRQEPGGHNLRCFFLLDDKAPIFSVDTPFYNSQIKKDLVINVYANGKWGCYRHLVIQDQSVAEVEHAYINTLNRGDLASLRWIEGPLKYYDSALLQNTILCSVYYAPLNFKDVMLATGKLSPDALPLDQASQDCILGLEFSGRDSSGRRLMGIVAACGLATTVLADSQLLWEVPDSWSLEEAATVPTVYATSYYALIVRGRMRPGETLLVHAGSGGVGQASISIALNMGVTVFTTVGSPEKRAFLKKRFPQLTDSHIFNSRDTSFEKHVMDQTAGRGVNLVLNSLSEDKLQASVRCLAVNGRFLEIGKFDLSQNNILGLSTFLGNKTFHGIVLDSLFGHQDSYKRREIARLVSEGIKSGAVVPLPKTVFPENEVEKAFRYMATGKHIGKVMLKIRNEEPEKVALPSQKLVHAIPRTFMNPQYVYLIVGGLGGIGLQLADWLVLRGATKLVLTSRSGVRTGYQSLCIRRWRELGVTVLVSVVNCSTEKETIQLMKDANKFGDVGGIFNLAAVLKDALFENQSEADFKAVNQSKVNTTKNLDMFSRILCPKLDHFVVFSSVSCGRGNPGQSNYGLANSVMERICEERQSVGLPALAVQWGAVGDVGLVAETMLDKASIRGTLPQRISSCLRTLDSFLRRPHPVVSSIVLAEKKQDFGPAGILDSVANILGIKDLKKVNGQATLADLGMDSLMSAEIKQVLERNYSIVLEPHEIRKLTFDELSQKSSNLVNSSSEHEKIALQVNSGISIPTEVLVKLPSRASEVAQEPPLFLVHPIEGVVTCLEPLAAQLPLPVWGLQCTAEAPLDSIQHLAAFYIKHVKKVHPNGHYNLGGYSFGATVAFEMALQLEKMGEQVSLFLIDGSPSWLSTYLQHLRPAGETPDSNKDETVALAYFVSLFLDLDIHEVRKSLSRSSNFQERLSLLGQLLTGQMQCPEQVVAAANSFYKKIVAAVLYKPAEKFKGDVTLFRANTGSHNTGYDYDLSKVCNSRVKVYKLESSHKNILQESCIKEIAPVISLAASVNKISHNLHDSDKPCI